MGPSNFNLRQSVDNYVNLIRNKGALTGSDVRELTDHLLDAADVLRKGGLSEEEAFIIASKRLGNDELLTEEYAKVNPSLSTNKIWAYLFIGYNLFYSIPSIVFMLFGGLYLFMYNQFEKGLISVIIISGAHILFTCLMIYLVRKKITISEFIENQVRKDPVRIVLVSFVPQVIFLVANMIFGIKFHLMRTGALDYPMRIFHFTLIEFTYYLAILSIIGAALSLIFSTKKLELISLRSLFEKPSVLFLVIFGVFIEFLAASTRVIHTTHVFQSSIIFGLVYLGASYLLSLYNRSSESLRYLIIFALFGFVMEVCVGIDADMSRGNTYNTIYFSTALLLGVFLGRKLGNKREHAKLIPKQS